MNGGGRRGTPGKKLALRRYRDKLIRERRRLSAHLGQMMRTTAGVRAHSPDEADVAAVSLEHETFCQISSAESDAVSMIDAALYRLETGAYGICEVCGRRISRARLELLPFTPVCVQCKAGEELSHMLANRRLFDDVSVPDWEELPIKSAEESGQEPIRGKRCAD